MAKKDSADEVRLAAAAMGRGILALLAVLIQIRDGQRTSESFENALAEARALVGKAAER